MEGVGQNSQEDALDVSPGRLCPGRPDESRLRLRWGQLFTEHVLRAGPWARCPFSVDLHPILGRWVYLYTGGETEAPRGQIRSPRPPPPQLLKARSQVYWSLGPESSYLALLTSEFLKSELPRRQVDRVEPRVELGGRSAFQVL